MLSRPLARTQQVQALRSALAHTRPEPVVVTGDAGSGRTTLLAQVRRWADPTRDAVLVLRPGDRVSISDLLEQAAGRRPVVIVDDAHLAGHDQMAVVRELLRDHGAAVFVSEPARPSEGPTPSPVDHIRFEAGVRTIALPPLQFAEAERLLAAIVGHEPPSAMTAALHTASGGNPGLLTTLAGWSERSATSEARTDTIAPASNSGDALASSGEHHGGEDDFPSARRSGTPDLEQCAREALVGAIHRAWQELALERLGILCQIARQAGVHHRIAPVWAGYHLLVGRPNDGLRLLDALESERPEIRRPESVFARALLVALGLGQLDRGVGLLADSNGGSPGSVSVPWDENLAKGAFLSAMAGRTREAADALADVPQASRRAAPYVFTAAGIVSLTDDDPAIAVSWFRRALACAPRLRSELPWLVPYLTACLLDALLLAGRIHEATDAVADFHAADEGGAWDIAVSLSTLAGVRWPGPLVTPAVTRAS